MDRLLKYALRHRIPVLGIALCYAVAAILSHEEGQDYVRLIQRDPIWMWAAVGLSVASMGYWGWRIWRSIGGMEKGVLPWGGLLAVAIAGYVFLMSYPTEVVHYLQFGILAGMLALVFRRVSPAFILTATFGILDEAYQYWWLHRAWGVYYDFNDVLLNVIAAALGLATVATLWPYVFVGKEVRAATQRAQRTQKREENRGIDFFHKYSAANAAVALPAGVASGTQAGASLRAPSYLFAGGLFVLFAVGVWTNLIAIERADVGEHTLLLLNRMPPFETFWETFSGTVHPHHLVRAWWGVVLTGVMTVAGVWTVERLRKEPGTLSSVD